MKQKNKKSSVWMFVFIFAGLFLWMLVANMGGKDHVSLAVKNNGGTAFLETAGNSLVAVFQDGRTVVWNWSAATVQRADFSVRTDRVCVLDSERLLTVSKTGKKVLSVVNLTEGKILKSFSVGQAGQDVWPRASLDKSVVALMRHNKPDSAETKQYEFLTVNLKNDLPGVPTALTIQQDSQVVVDFVVDSDDMVYVAGSHEEVGRIVAIDLDRGKIRWDKTYDDTKEFCSVMVASDGKSILAGNRNGLLYQLDAQTGDLAKPIQLLEEGETRPITNDYSVLNAAFSPDGRYYVVTINPKAYILDAATHKIVHTLSPADKLVSKIAFSPDNRFVATSDIRAGYPVKIWKFLEENNK